MIEGAPCGIVLHCLLALISVTMPGSGRTLRATSIGAGPRRQVLHLALRRTSRGTWAMPVTLSTTS